MATKSFDFTELVQAVVDGESEDAVSIVETILAEEISPVEIIEKGLVPGMNIVSDKYDKKLYFVPDLAASAEAMSDALELINPRLEATNHQAKEKIVIGVVKECSQEIGKNIVAAMLRGAGYTVHDMGINVSPAQFVEKCKEVNASIIGMGSPMLQTVKYFEETVEELKKQNMRDDVMVLIGGASTDEDTVKKVGADAWAKNAKEAVLVVEEFMASKRG